MLGFILYSVVALLIQVPQQPDPGTYYIYNSVPSYAGAKLAATFQGDQTNVIVTPLTKSAEQQVWLDISSHFLLSVSLNFVVDSHTWRAIYNTC